MTVAIGQTRYDQGMGGVQKAVLLFAIALLFSVPGKSQVIGFESGGLRYYALTRSGLTVMVAQLPAQIRDYNVLQVAVSNGGNKVAIVRPEDFVFIRDDGSEVPAVAPRTVVNSMISRASRSDVVKLITSYESSIYGNTQYKATNGYEARRQSAMTEFTSTRMKAAAAASAIAFVQTKLAPGESTDGAIFYPSVGKTTPTGTVRVRIASNTYDFPLTSTSHNGSQSP